MQFFMQIFEKKKTSFVASWFLTFFYLQYLHVQTTFNFNEHYTQMHKCTCRGVFEFTIKFPPPLNGIHGRLVFSKWLHFNKPSDPLQTKIIHFLHISTRVTTLLLLLLLIIFEPQRLNAVMKVDKAQCWLIWFMSWVV